MKIIKNFEFRKPVGGKGKYRWDEWLDGQIRVLDDSDFGDAQLQTVSSLARSVAKKRGLSVRIAINTDDNTITLQSFEPDDGLTTEQRIALWESEAEERREGREQEESLKNGKGAEEEQPAQKKGKGGKKS